MARTDSLGYRVPLLWRGGAPPVLLAPPKGSGRAGGMGVRELFSASMAAQAERSAQMRARQRAPPKRGWA
jgi:hypothetical protein